MESENVANVILVLNIHDLKNSIFVEIKITYFFFSNDLELHLFFNFEFLWSFKILNISAYYNYSALQQMTKSQLWSTQNFRNSTKEDLLPFMSVVYYRHFVKNFDFDFAM